MRRICGYVVKKCAVKIVKGLSMWGMNPPRYIVGHRSTLIQQFLVKPAHLANTGQECPAYRDRGGAKPVISDRRGFLTPFLAYLHDI